ncbi:uncharacterized protein LOC125620639 isoform X2 [Caretta caretta]|uniref:uncharacterized protein LOC125620639 isoform X2 n=1 Tax=Caretta caretta TaxID=8467 RepID=UPI003F4B3550
MSRLQRGGRVGSSPGGCFPGRASISLYRSVDLSLLKESKSEWRCLGLIAGDEWSLSAAQERAAVQTGSDILLELGVTPICLEQLHEVSRKTQPAAQASRRDLFVLLT